MTSLHFHDNEVDDLEISQSAPAPTLVLTLKSRVQTGNKHLNKQLKEKWYQFMQQMPATDFKV